jgi:hypothetical protein
MIENEDSAVLTRMYDILKPCRRQNTESLKGERKVGSFP